MSDLLSIALVVGVISAVAAFARAFAPPADDGDGAAPRRWWGHPGEAASIDARLDAAVTRFGGRGLAALHAYAKTLPSYRTVDLHRALQELLDAADAHTVVDSANFARLDLILSRQFDHRRDALVRPTGRLAFSAGEGEDVFLPADGFHVVRRHAGGAPVVVRLKVIPHQSAIDIEVAADTEAEATALVTALVERASAVSIYRGHTLDVSFDAEVRDEYGDIAGQGGVDLRFRPRVRLEDHEIILDPDQRALLEHLLVDFHTRRATLRRLGLPARRGVLFYGPPGTGKTHTCKYLSARLEGVTTLVASGRTLLHARSLCQIARMLQPSLVVLEDVDLVYAERDSNAYGVALGELMDELDGFAREDEILFVLTTNELARVEAAIRDRPGRISQCLYFGPPEPPLRRRYLAALVAPYRTDALDLDAVVRATDRSTQAFLRELVARAVQRASVGTDAETPAALALGTAHVLDALAEMKQGAGREGAAILGFHVPPAA